MAESYWPTGQVCSGIEAIARKNGGTSRWLSGEVSDKALSAVFGDIDAGIADALQNGPVDF